MTKYTIKKAFNKAFPHPIWKIEVDQDHASIAVEYRCPETTKPFFSVFDLSGDTILDDYGVDEKEWTLAGIQNGRLILKNYGHDTPIQSGIKIIDILEKREIVTHLQYVYVELHNGYVVARHRSIPSGLFYYINIQTGEYSTQHAEYKAINKDQVYWPRVYTSKMPDFMNNIKYSDEIWLQKLENNYIWAYHKKQNYRYSLYLTLSTQNELLDEIEVIKDLPKLILHPFFIVNHNILILSGNKREIVSYLV